MYLKSLTLKGFKSFADRSVLTLEPGISAIVGPNGSGKSNILDAVLWVLGERNAKNLRGQVMEDVIFAGSSARKSVSMAEVCLVLDNSDGALPVDYSEVSLTRRMYRSGESEYLINNTVARRLDVLDILHDSGLGTATYSIISQGNLDAILQSKPQDRRALIEEAAGVLKHKQRKLKSQRRIEQVEHNFDRVQDVVNEVARQLAPLERKAKRATTYLELSERLSELNVRLAVDDVRELQKKWEATEQHSATLEQEAEQRKQAIERAEETSVRIQELMRTENENVTKLANKHRVMSETASRLDAHVLLFQEKKRNATLRYGDLEALVASNEQRRKTLQQEHAHFEHELVELTQDQEAATHTLSLAQETYDEAQRALSELERNVATQQNALHQLQHEEKKAFSLFQQAKKQLESAQSRARLSDEKMESLTSTCKTANQEQCEAQAHLQACTSALAQAHKLQLASKNTLDQAKEKLAAAISEHENAQEQERDCAARMTALEQLEHELLAKTSQARGWLDNDEQKTNFTLAPLLQEMKVDAGFEVVVERLLGSDVSALLVQNAQNVSKLSSELQKQHIPGVVTLLLETDNSRQASSEIGIPSEALVREHACTLLLDHIQASANAREAVSALLGGVVVCETLARALELHHAFGARMQCVCTKQGDIVYANGRIVLGSTNSNTEQNALSRSRQLEEIRSQHRDYALNVQACSDALTRAQAALDEAQKDALEKSQHVAQAQGMAASASQDCNVREKRAQKASENLKRAQADREQIEQCITKTLPEVEKHDQAHKRAKQALEQAQTRVNQCIEAREPARERANHAQSELSDAKLKAAVLSERLVYLQRVLNARTEELAKLEQSDTTSARLQAIQTCLQQRAQVLVELFTRLAQSAQARAAQLEHETHTHQVENSTTQAQAQRAQAAVRDAREAFQQTSNQLSEVRIEKGRLEVQVQTSVSLIAQEYHLSLEQALEQAPLMNRSACEQEVFNLKRRIANMGSINPDAASEYEELKNRYDFLSSQLCDMKKARDSLQKINNAIDNRMKDDFLRTFHEANNNFQQIFSDLFPGGTAQLSLVEEGTDQPPDSNSAGVEITAQPRGKKITKMSLMSGGEKSLVALALLFAVYKVRNTPFYILDEVEAALDDTNLRRLIDYLQKLRTSTQLIMITHQRRTMEMADVLYGVSMQADGVTKVLSQRLEHALTYAQK